METHARYHGRSLCKKKGALTNKILEVKCTACKRLLHSHLGKEHFILEIKECKCLDCGCDFMGCASFGLCAPCKRRNGSYKSNDEEPEF